MCGKWYDRQDGPIMERCAVIHAEGDCCHFREIETENPKGTKGVDDFEEYINS